jgi:peptide/nickel transport system substrate-binding protein
MLVIYLPTDIDPHGVLFDTMSGLLSNVTYEPLMDYNPDTRQVEGVLATDWSVDDEGKVYTFTLRDGVTFHDGSALTAEAVKLSFERIMEINGARAQFLRGVENIEVVDDHTVAIHLEDTNATFMANLQDLPIASAEALKTHDKAWFETNAAGSGPYQLDGAYVPGSDSIRFVPYADYWRGWGREGFVRDLPEGVQHVGPIEFRVVPESATQRLLLESGEAHFMWRFPISYLSEFENSPLVKTQVVPEFRISLLPLNVAHGPLQDIRLRQMLQYAFPYDAYIEYYRGMASPAPGPINPQFLEDDTLQAPVQDLDRAAELLAEAGYAPGELTLRYVYPTGGEEQRQPGILLQDALAQIGVNLVVDTIPWASIVELVASGAENAPDVMTLINSPKGTDPGVAFLVQFYHSVNSGRNYNWSRYNNPEVDALLDQAIRTVDQEARYELYRQAQRLIVADAPSVFLAYPNRWVAMNRNLSGFWFSPISQPGIPWYEMYWEE